MTWKDLESTTKGCVRYYAFARLRITNLELNQLERNGYKKIELI